MSSKQAGFNGPKASDASAIEPVILSRALGNLQHFKKDIQELRINDFYEMRPLLVKIFSQEYRRSIQNNALTIHANALAQGIADPFPFITPTTRPEDVDLLQVLMVKGFWSNILDTEYPMPEFPPGTDTSLKKVKYSMWEKTTLTRKKHAEELFAYIMHHIAMDSYTTLTTPGERYAKIQDGSNIFALWLLIESYHTGLDTHVKAKKKLQSLRASIEEFPTFAVYCNEVATSVKQLEGGAGSVDLQDISTWVLDACIHRFGKGAGCVNKYLVPRKNRTLPPWNELLMEFNDYDISLNTFDETDMRVTTSLDCHRRIPTSH